MGLKNILLYLTITTILTGCFGTSDSVDISGLEESQEARRRSQPSSLSSISVQNNQLVLGGKNLDNIVSVKITGPSSFNEDFEIESQNSNSLIANGIRNMTILASGIFSLIITDASGASSYSITFTPENNSITGAMINDMNASDGDALTYNSTTDDWEPTPLSGISLVGTWDANLNSPSLASGGLNTSPDLGDFYIVGTAGTTLIDTVNTWNAGDWILYNGSTWERVANSTTITSFNGRVGAVTPDTNDYTWAQINKTSSSINDLTDVDTTGAIVDSILKFNGTTWVVDTDETGGGASNSVTSTTSSAINADSVGDGTGDINFQIDSSTVAQFTNAGDFIVDTNSLVVDASTNRVGVGVLSPDATLHIGEGATQSYGTLPGGTPEQQLLVSETTGSSTVATSIQVSDGTRNSRASFFLTDQDQWGLFSTYTSGGDIPFTITNGGIERLRIGTSGNVGLGTTNPGDALEINNTLPEIRLTDSDGGFGVLSGNGAHLSFSADAANAVGASRIAFEIDGTEHLRIINNGNVGIGTTSPAVNLEVSDVSTARLDLVGDNDNSSSDNDIQLRFWKDGNQNSGTRVGTIAYDEGNDVLNISKGSIGQNHITINSSGNIGIGTSAPSSKLDVITSSANDGLKVQRSDGERSAWLVDNGTGNGSLYLYNGSNSNSLFLTGNGDSFINGGRLGIGTSTPSSLFHVDGSASGVISYFEGNQAYTDYVRSSYTLGSAGLRIGVGSSNQHEIKTLSAIGLAIGTNNTTRMTVDSTGNVGIGTTSPNFNLEVIGNSSLSRGTSIDTTTTFFIGGAKQSSGTDFARIDFVNWDNNDGTPEDYTAARISSENTSGAEYGDLRFYTKSTSLSSTPAMYISANGRIGIGTISPGEILEVYNGSTTGTYTTSGWSHSSDRRLKKDIISLEENTLEKILKLEPVEYVFNNDKEMTTQVGFIAQDVEPIFPEVIRTNNKGFKSMIYANLVSPLVKALQEFFSLYSESQEEQNRRIANLEKENLEQKEKIQKLEERLLKIEQSLEKR